MRFLARKGEGFVICPSYRKGVLGFFPYDAAGNRRTLYGFFGAPEIVMTPNFPKAYTELLAPQGFWEEMGYYIKEFNAELTSHGLLPLEGVYLTLPPKGKNGYGCCEITLTGELNLGMYEQGKAIKFRPYGWLDIDKGEIFTFQNKPYTLSQITYLY